MGYLRSLLPWDDDTYGNKVRTLRVLVECEKGSTHKYEWDDAINAPVIVRDLHKKYAYPYNYGSIPQTLAEDGDSLDAIVISDETIRSGTIINCRPIAIVRMIDNGEKDDKVICAPFYMEHGDVDMKKILHYLQNYKYPKQEGTEVKDVEGADAAVAAIEDAHRAFMVKKNSEIRTR
ncbi:MAG: inorganic diphosphatase [Acetobacter sp.]|nr:inorganic diphosphatase [Acetobacter sp.]